MNLDYDRLPNNVRVGKVYTKTTADSVIYYYYSPYPRSGPTSYYFPVIQKVIPRRNRRWDDNNDFSYTNYYPYYSSNSYPYPQYPYYYQQPRPQYYPPPYYYHQPYYRTFAGFQFGGTAPDNGFNYDPTKTQKGSPSKGSITPATPSAVDNLIKKNPQKSGEVVTPFGTPKGEPNVPYSKNSDGTPARTTNPSSGCQNCKTNDFLCEIGKAGCELGHVAQDGLGQYGIPILIAGGAIVLILLLK